ncbi:flagellar hook-length control protein FliK [Thalassococcus sp. CAU 1522]|uniref:Flagellar hook-length control protein FliK n=1 Tax=Thalassococcus arenae TaxID=2851652 RepID=A0ABS6N6A7_9RHOB|nr:flagellar hook-length control protein FliK [Thalassococcus arenae]MBV2359323.1 flagellar hook-length control protein FliK [Thalassococcus arenae]
MQTFISGLSRHSDPALINPAPSGGTTIAAGQRDFSRFVADEVSKAEGAHPSDHTERTVDGDTGHMPAPSERDNEAVEIPETSENPSTRADRNDAPNVGSRKTGALATKVAPEVSHAVPSDTATATDPQAEGARFDWNAEAVEFSPNLPVAGSEDRFDVSGSREARDTVRKHPKAQDPNDWGSSPWVVPFSSDHFGVSTQSVTGPRNAVLSATATPVSSTEQAAPATTPSAGFDPLQKAPLDSPRPETPAQPLLTGQQPVRKTPNQSPPPAGARAEATPRTAQTLMTVHPATLAAVDADSSGHTEQAPVARAASPIVQSAAFTGADGPGRVGESTPGGGTLDRSTPNVTEHPPRARPGFAPVKEGVLLQPHSVPGKTDEFMRGRDVDISAKDIRPATMMRPATESNSKWSTADTTAQIEKTAPEIRMAQVPPGSRTGDLNLPSFPPERFPPQWSNRLSDPVAQIPSHNPANPAGGFAGVVYPDTTRLGKADFSSFPANARSAIFATSSMGDEEAVAGSISDESTTTFTAANQATTSPTAVTAAPAKPATVPVAVRQVIEQMVRLGDSVVELRLDPEELGHVRMQITAGETGLQMAIAADRPETLDLLRRHIDQLARALAAAGYGEASFEFSHNGRPQPQERRGEQSDPIATDPADSATHARKGPLPSAVDGLNILM